jgi:hypothetical protein
MMICKEVVDKEKFTDRKMRFLINKIQKTDMITIKKMREM